MTAPFECEVRVLIEDIEAFHRRIRDLGGTVRLEYAFTDHYLRSHGTLWDLRRRALRVREHHQPAGPSEVLLTAVDVVQHNGLQFKRSQFAEGKRRLFAGALDDCRAVVESLGFEPWLVVRKRDGRLFEIPQLGELVTEHVDGVGWMCEIEVAGIDASAASRAIRARLDALGIPPSDILPDPVAAIVAARTGTGRKVYFCGSIRGGRALQPLYASIVAFLQERGFQVLTTHVAAPDVLKQEWREGVKAEDIYRRDLRWLAECDLVIAEVSTPSLGVGVEIAEAQHLGKPVLALCRDGVSLSAMVSGNAAVHLITYRGEADLMARLEQELR